MLLARRNNDSNWLSNFFDDNFFDTDWMPRMNGTAPAVNVKETSAAYTMEVAAPGHCHGVQWRSLTEQGGFPHEKESLYLSGR